MPLFEKELTGLIRALLKTGESRRALNADLMNVLAVNLVADYRKTGDFVLLDTEMRRFCRLVKEEMAGIVPLLAENLPDGPESRAAAH